MSTNTASYQVSQKLPLRINETIYCRVQPSKLLESTGILQFLFPFENSFTIFTLEFWRNIMLLFLVFLYMFSICAFLLTNFAIRSCGFFSTWLLLTIWYHQTQLQWVWILLLNFIETFLPFISVQFYEEDVSLTVAFKQLS